MPGLQPSINQDRALAARRQARSFNPVDRIVVPVEGTDREYVVEQMAIELAATMGVPVRAVHVSPHGGPPDWKVFQYLQHEASEWGVSLQTQELEGEDVATQIINDLEPKDLVVIGTRRMARDYHLGSVAAELIKRAPCPVQVLRLPGERRR